MNLRANGTSARDRPSTINGRRGELDGGRPKSSVSHHFRILREAGLVRTRVAGTAHQNSLRRAELDARCPGSMEAVIKQIINNSALSESA
jgi:DNA-binding transcriptional ArsR family regulator